jgi:hypothetical protein
MTETEFAFSLREIAERIPNHIVGKKKKPGG